MAIGAGRSRSRTVENVRLTLDRRDGKPYTYRATQTYTLDGPTLVVTLEIENTGREALPFGLGVHPFFVRDADTELSAAAGGLWLSGDDWLPVRHVQAPPAWQFGVAYPLPATIVNHAFTGWSGPAAVVWPKRRLSLNIAADTDYYVLYTPPGEDFFCFEPVDHPINAMNLAGGAKRKRHDLAGPRRATDAHVPLHRRTHRACARCRARAARSGGSSGRVGEAAACA